MAIEKTILVASDQHRSNESDMIRKCEGEREMRHHRDITNPSKWVREKVKIVN